MELFIDESGDLGGIKSNKRYFVVEGVVCEEEKVSHTIKPLLRELSLPELKFSRLSYEEKKVVLSKLAALDFGIVYTVLSKNDETLKRWLDRSKRNKLLAAKALHSALILGLGSQRLSLTGVTIQRSCPNGWHARGSKLLPMIPSYDRASSLPTRLPTRCTFITSTKTKSYVGLSKIKSSSSGLSPKKRF